MCKFIIDTNEILDNLRCIKNSLGFSSKICAVVKADAYGFGMNKMVSLLKNNVDYFAVARLTEFLNFKKLEVNKPCLILSPLSFKELFIAIKNGAEITVTNLETLKNVDVISKKISRRVLIHIKIDTGMNRFGFKCLEQINEVNKLLNENPLVELVGIYTHSFNKKDEQVTRRIMTCFVEKTEVLLKSLKNQKTLDEKIVKPLIHTSFCNGLQNYKENVSMIRVGYDLFTAKTNSNHKFVCSIVEIKEVKNGQTIGYDGAYKVKKDTVIAVCNAGYADGVNRLLSNCGSVIINGKKYRIVGKVCMDSFMVEIGNNSFVNIGDEVVIFGKSEEMSISVCDIANTCGTIPYEVYTSISSRVKRVYRWRKYASYYRKIRWKAFS